MLAKVDSGTPFIPGMKDYDRSPNTVNNLCPKEIEATNVSPYYYQDRWLVDIIPVNNIPQGYYHAVAADRVTIDGKKLWVVKVPTVHFIPVPVFAKDSQTAISKVSQGDVLENAREGSHDYTLNRNKCTANLAH